MFCNVNRKFYLTITLLIIKLDISKFNYFPEVVMKKITLIILLLCICFGPQLLAQSLIFHGQLKNSVYCYKDEEATTRIYQYLRLNTATAYKKIVFNSMVRVLSDANVDLADKQRFQTWQLNLQFQKLFNNHLKMTIGRQFFHPGVMMGALDGINAEYSIGKNLFQVYGGAESTISRSLDLNQAENRQVVGGFYQISNLLSTKTTAQLLFLHKADTSATLWQIAGLNINNRYFNNTTLNIQAHYNTANDNIQRLLIAGQRLWTERLSTSVELKMQRPQIYANSFYTIFSAKPYQRVELNGSYRLWDNVHVNAGMYHIQTDDAAANCVQVALQNQNGSLGVVYEAGDAGDQVSLAFDYGLEVIHNLVFSIYTDYSKYRTETIYEFDDQIANAARLSWRLSRHFSADVEYQWLTNKYKTSDSRLLNHISCRW
mgnify:CR=1 FL=1